MTDPSETRITLDELVSRVEDIVAREAFEAGMEVYVQPGTSEKWSVWVEKAYNDYLNREKEEE